MLSKKKNEQRSLLCIDIGSSSVKACVFAEEDDALTLKGQSHVAQFPHTLQGGSIINLNQAIRSVQDAVRKAENMAKISPKEMVLGVSGELVKGVTMTLDYERDKPGKRLDAQELKTIIYELQWQAFDQIRRQISDEMSIPEMELKLINASIISIRVDGEVLHDPRGSTGEKVTIEIFNCFAPLQHFGQLQSIAVELPYHELKGVFIQSFAVCHSLSLQNTLESAMVIDIGAGTTDVCVLIDGHIVGNRSFSLGGNSLTKRISHELSTSFDEAESIKLGYCKEELDKRSQKVVEEAIQPDIEIWISSLEFCLKELPIKKLPQKILICGNSSLLPEFQEALEEHDWSDHFPFDGKMQVRHLDYADILSGDSHADSFEPDYLPLIAVGYTAYDLLYTNASIEGILSSVIADT